jgi:hypothetical protein
MKIEVLTRVCWEVEVLWFRDCDFVSKTVAKEKRKGIR